MTEIVDQYGKPLRLSVLSDITRASLALFESALESSDRASRDLELALNLAALRRSCGLAGEPMGATITIRRPARYTPKERA